MLFSPSLFPSISAFFFVTSKATQQKATDAKRQSNPPQPNPSIYRKPPPPTTPPSIFSLWHSSHYLWDLVKPNLHVFVRPWLRILQLFCLTVAGQGGVLLLLHTKESVQQTRETRFYNTVWLGFEICELRLLLKHPTKVRVLTEILAK